ncbi:MAG: branched-chain amino acid ABC transporter substrate-binding protein [Solirubrobacterales bacterium]|nr:branched-chain amino acid ABC transporter substrate-binding protein [Solirubrobacterales bacterium]
MLRRLVAAPLAVTVALAGLVLVACGSGDNKVTSVQAVDADCGDVQYSGSGTASKLIVSDLPLKGDSAERSKQMNDAIVQELARKGWQAGSTQVAFQACDDSLESTGEWDESLCRSNADAYASNPDVIGVIGTYNSGCAAVEIPILNRAPGGGLAMVSPGNTLVCLTEPGSICKPNEPDVYYPSGRRNYIRVVPNDAVQMAGLATFANEQGIRKTFVLVAARDPTSKGQADTFVGAAAKLGMQIAGTAEWDQRAKSYTELMSQVKASGADSVLLAGLLEQNGARIIKDKVSVLGPNDGAVKLLAPDGFAQQATIEQAGPASKGMFVSQPGKVPSSLTGAGSAFVKEVKAQVGGGPLEVFAPYAGQAAEVLIPAIQSGDGTRAGVIESLFRTHVSDGIVGSFEITPSGDPSPAPISVSQAAETFRLAKTITPLPQLIAAARGG